MDKGHKPLAHAQIMISGKKAIMRKSVYYRRENKVSLRGEEVSRIKLTEVDISFQ